MKLLLEFSRNLVQEPLIAETILETGILVSIDYAKVEGEECWLLLSVDSSQAEQFIQAVKKRGVSVHYQENSVVYDESECVDCGLCISLCMKQVFSFDAGWKLVVDADRCVLCGRCAQFCPQRALTVQR